MSEISFECYENVHVEGINKAFFSIDGSIGGAGTKINSKKIDNILKT